jgi:hypothetical protein
MAIALALRAEPRHQHTALSPSFRAAATELPDKQTPTIPRHSIHTSPPNDNSGDLACRYAVILLPTATPIRRSKMNPLPRQRTSPPRKCVRIRIPSGTNSIHFIKHTDVHAGCKSIYLRIAVRFKAHKVQREGVPSFTLAIKVHQQPTHHYQDHPLSIVCVVSEKKGITSGPVFRDLEIGNRHERARMSNTSFEAGQNPKGR